jgi:isoleucyl-tRNA synthetase
MPYNANENELEILKFWEEHKTFEKSVSMRDENKPYVFYDGPPFATGLPHYGHIVASVMKDVVPRYWTMNGKRVERVWGWDCHGLPIENIVEKELGTKSKKEIEEMGVAKFNEMCRSKVLSYVDEWEKTINRLGRWVDMKNAYRTMDNDYMESVWWVFKQLWEKDLVYHGYRPMHICPRCETTLSQQEVSEGYKDVKDISVTAKFEVTNAQEKLGLEGDVFVLAWTTTPWTLPGNVLLAVGKDIEYVVVKNEISGSTRINDDESIEKPGYYIFAKERFGEFVGNLLSPDEKQLLDLSVSSDALKNLDNFVCFIKGSELVGLEYVPLFPYFAESKNSFRVVTADFVTTEDGTGVVHLAPAFGTDDYEVFKKENVPFIQHVGMDGKFIDAVTDFAGMHVKPSEDHTATDVEIVKWLAHNGKLFSKKKYEHSYPHCWRCDTPLINYATSSWFVNVTKIKEKALAEAEKINWSPEHIKEGRFGKWLEGARDWSISRQRFWATVIPVWQSAEGDSICVGSLKELEELSGKKVSDLHKHVVDEITFEKDGKLYKRVPDVLDTWFDSGSMPYAQVHYPFEQKEKFEAGFPAEFIAEGQDQTRAWFYYLHVLATSLFGGPAYKNVIVNGIVLAEDGKKMSKKLKNYPDPNVVLEKYGADALRYYLCTSPVMHAENLNFSEAGVREMYGKLINTLSNVLEFYLMFAGDVKNGEAVQSKNILDQWILAKLQLLVKEVTENMNAYKLSEASRPIVEFVTELSQWYVRRSRDRFKGEDEADKQAALFTLHEVLLTLSKVMAPFTPFFAEKMYKDVGGAGESVHLESWPVVDEKLLNTEVLSQMEVARKVVEMGLSLRAETGMKVRQPLGVFTVNNTKITREFLDIISDEMNVKEVVCGEIIVSEKNIVKEDGEVKVALNIEITEELKKEGYLRELVRTINQMRKEMNLTVQDPVVIEYATSDELLQSVLSEYADELKKSVLATELRQGTGEKEVEIDGKKISLSVQKQ